MSFWKTFVKVWQVRTSIRIQESMEISARAAKRQAELDSNLTKIAEEVVRKNKSWKDQLEHHRKNST
jgi:hypothetical protein